MTFLLIFCAIMYLLRNVRFKSIGLCCDPSGGIITTMVVMGAAGGAQAASQVQAGKAQASNLQYQANLLDTQKMLAQRTADQNSKFAQDKAAEDSKMAYRNSSQIDGAQKVALAANGIGGGSGTAADIALDTFDKAKLDQLAIQYNADSKSWGFQEDAKNQVWDMTNKQNQLRVVAKNAKTAANQQAFGTLLRTAASVASVGMMAGAGGAGAGAGASSGGSPWYSMKAGLSATGY